MGVGRKSGPFCFLMLLFNEATANSDALIFTEMPPRLRRRLLLDIALTNIGAVSGIVAAMWLTEDLTTATRWSLRAALFILVAFVWTSILRRRIALTVEQPLAQTVDAAHAIAAGDTARRVPLGETLEFVALSQSINRMTEQLLEAEKGRMRVEKLVTMGRLAAGISHEIGNPLAALANYVHVVRMRAGSDHTVTEPIDAMEREIQRVDRIMRGLLDYSRPRRLTPKPVIVDRVIDDIVQLLTDQGVLKHARLDKRLSAESASVYTERHDLEQVFVNLLLNAGDAVSKDGTIVLSTRTVSVEDIVNAAPARRDDVTRERWIHRPNGRALEWLANTDKPQRVLQVVVADSGPGVPLEDEERIFEPFFTTKVPGKGTGLGLAIVARTIENLGGTIWVQRAREGGAAFVLLLPLHHS